MANEKEPYVLIGLYESLYKEKYGKKPRLNKFREKWAMQDVIDSVGFYTKYGDGGVDIAPIADLYKTEVWELGKYLGVDQRIIDAPPTDGLWEDSRSDEDQIGASYAELEEAMEYGTGPALEILKKFNAQNKHKMEPIPTFKL